MDRVTGLFPLWAVLISAAAMIYPAPLIPLKGAIMLLLGVVMFGMGVTLTPLAVGVVLASVWSRTGRR
jgi:BASS family bile acid:Na+ symporter